MMTLTKSNYYTPAANMDYWSVSLFKAFDACEACGLATARGEYEREQTESMLLGSYVDAYFSDELDEFMSKSGDKVFTLSGELRAKFSHANECIDAVEAQPLMREFLTGEKQVIMTAELFDVPWKIKIDVHGGTRIVDLKCVKDFQPIYKDGFGRMPWLEYWGYDIQGAIYQRIEQIYSGRTEPLPFYIVAVTKEKVPDVAVIQIPQHVLDTALKLVEAKIDRFDLIKMGEIEPERCGKCEYCRKTKILTEPSVFEIEEA